MSGRRGVDLREAPGEAQRLSRLIDDGIRALREQSQVLAARERDYRRAKAEAWVRCPRDSDPRARNWSAGRREAWVDAETAGLRFARDMADGLRQAALEAVRARRAQLSALQTLMNAHGEEAKFVRTTGGVGA